MSATTAARRLLAEALAISERALPENPRIGAIRFEDWLAANAAAT